MENNGILLLNLPNIILYNVFSNWVNLNALSRFDSALSRSGYRAEFLALLAAPISIFRGVLEDLESRSWDYCYWIINRRIKVSQLLVSRTMSSLHPEVLLQFFQQVGPHLRTLKSNEFFVSAYVSELMEEHCPFVEHVEFCGTAVKTKYAKAFILARTAMLRNLKISCSKYIGEDIFRNQMYVHLEVLNIRCGGELLHVISTACPRLRSLCCGPPVMQGTQSTPFEHVKPMPALEAIKFECVRNLTDTAFAQLLQVCPKITDITLDACTGLTSAALFTIANHCGRLQSLRLRNLPRVTIAGLQEVLSRRADTLRLCGVTNCTSMDSVQVTQLLQSYGVIEEV